MLTIYCSDREKVGIPRGQKLGPVAFTEGYVRQQANTPKDGMARNISSTNCDEDEAVFIEPAGWQHYQLLPVSRISSYPLLLAL
jgi:hypothetical protein